jgi:hypothetical protein
VHQATILKSNNASHACDVDSVPSWCPFAALLFCVSRAVECMPEFASMLFPSFSPHFHAAALADALASPANARWL